MNSYFDFSEVRSTERWGKDVIEYESVDEFFGADVAPNALLSISMNNVLLELNVDLKKDAPLVVFFNGATERTSELKLPIFSGMRVLPEGEVSRVYVNDPSHYLDKELTLGWYAGSSEAPLQGVFADVIKKIAGEYSSRSVIFVGGSGGGYAALYYSKKISGSLALVWNPQTNILNYWPRHVSNYAKAAFGIEGINAAKEELGDRIDLDLCSIYEGGSVDNYVIYLQNVNDWHVEKHCLPFFAAMKKNLQLPLQSERCAENIFLCAGNWGEGHAAPSPMFLKSLIGDLVEKSDGWKTLFDTSLSELLLKAAAAQYLKK